MLKLVTLFAAVALAAAQVAPLTYSSGVLPYSAGAWPYSAGVPYTAGAWPYSAGSAYSAGAWPYSAGVPYTAGAWPYSSVYSGYPYNYGLRSGIATQLPNTPALALDPVNKVPLDTPEVAAAKVEHFNAVAGAHAIQKRSVVSHVSHVTHVAPVAPVSPVAPVAPLAYNAYSQMTPYAYNGYNAYNGFSAYPRVASYSAPWVSPYSAAVPAYGYRGAYPYAY